MEKHERIAVGVLCLAGAVQKKNERGYYQDEFCGGPSFDFKETKKALRLIEEVGIDWEKTSTVQDDYSQGFNGTFDPPKRVIYFATEIVLNSGEKFRFAIGEVRDLSELFKHFEPAEKFLEKLTFINHEKDSKN